MNRRLMLAALPLVLTVTAVASQTTTADKDWKAQAVTLKGTPEAEFIIRIGDVDNLGFGWPERFDPFCGRTTMSHAYPWRGSDQDAAGFDRMLISSRFSPQGAGRTCGGDGYSSSQDPPPARPVAYAVPIDALKGATIRNAYLQMFIDDFQAPVFCSKFEVTLNGTRFVEAERVLNAIEQTGPVGKLVTLRIPEEFHAALAAGGTFTVKVDDVNGAADGFALDFIRVLVNRNREAVCQGDVTGHVRDKETGAPVAGARVAGSDGVGATTNAEGFFQLKGVPAGYETIVASASGYNDGSRVADVASSGETPEVEILLEKGRTAAFGGSNLKAGETITLNNILFDQGKADLRPASRTELDRIVTFMKANPNAEIELSGHTSSEGEAALNRSLSYLRVKTCKDYIVAAGVDTGRILVAGYGPDRPVAPNDTEANRARNRRVEMRVLKL